MTIRARTIALSTTAAAVVTNAELAHTPLNRLYSIAIKNVDGLIDVHIGGSTVTSAGANGFTLAAGNSISIDLAPGDELYAVAASGTPNIDVLEAGYRPGA